MDDLIEPEEIMCARCGEEVVDEPGDLCTAYVHEEAESFYEFEEDTREDEKIL